MRQQSARKFERQLWLQWLTPRLKWLAVSLLVVGLILFATWRLDRDPIVKRENLLGTVMHWSQEQSKDSTTHKIIEVRVDGGQRLTLQSSTANTLIKGQRIVIEKTTRKSGWVYYRYIGVDVR